MGKHRSGILVNHKIESVVAEAMALLICMGADGFKGFGTEHVLHTACVFGSNLRRNAKGGQPAGEQPVALIDALCDFPPGWEQGNIAVFIHIDIAIFPQISHGDAHAWLGEFHLVCNIDGAQIPQTLFQDENCFQIVFGRFVNLHE